MSKLKQIIALFAISTLLGCAPNVQYLTKRQAYPNMYEEKPVAVLVVPAINQSTAADAPDLYASTIAEPLAVAGYYVFPIEVTTRIFRNEGIHDGAQISKVKPEKFREMFGADAVMFVNIEEWDTNYYVIGGNVTVALKFNLVSTHTGATLWQEYRRQVINTSGNSNSGILAAMIETAIKTAMQDYVPVARIANNTAIAVLPFGKYHPLTGQDSEYKTRVPADTTTSQY